MKGRLKITTRETKPEDAALLAAAIDEVARERRFLALTEGFPPEGVRSFIEHLRSVGGVHMIALIGKDVVGWCDVSPLPFEGMKHVGRLGMGILKDYRNIGFGTKLLRSAQEHAYNNGLTRIELEVFSTNMAAIHLYEKFGFVLEGRKSGVRLLDGVSSDILLYATHKEVCPEREQFTGTGKLSQKLKGQT